jgi:hypothetical protein
MTRSARMVISGLPHHVTQRGNRREAIFFEDGDKEVYRDLLARAGAQGWYRGMGGRRISSVNLLLRACCRSAHRLS